MDNKEVSYGLLPSHNEKKLNAMKAPRTVKRITFNASKASPGETLNVHMPKLNENEVIVSNSLAVIFDIDLSGGHANNFLVQNVSRALVEKLVVKFAGAVLDETVGYDIYKTFQALYNDLVFELTLAPANQVVRGSDTTKLKYKVTNIQLEYEMIRSKKFEDKAARIYTSGKEFAYDHVFRDKVVPFDKGTDTRINIKVNAQRRSMKGILLLFVEPYVAGTRDSENTSSPT